MKEHYLLASAFSFAMLALIWSHVDGKNAFIKAIFLALAIAGFVLRFA